MAVMHIQPQDSSVAAAVNHLHIIKENHWGEGWDQPDHIHGLE